MTSRAVLGRSFKVVISGPPKRRLPVGRSVRLALYQAFVDSVVATIILVVRNPEGKVLADTLAKSRSLILAVRTRETYTKTW